MKHTLGVIALAAVIFAAVTVWHGHQIRRANNMNLAAAYNQCWREYEHHCDN